MRKWSFEETLTGREALERYGSFEGRPAVWIDRLPEHVGAAVAVIATGLEELAERRGVELDGFEVRLRVAPEEGEFALSVRALNDDEEEDD